MTRICCTELDAKLLRSACDKLGVPCVIGDIVDAMWGCDCDGGGFPPDTAAGVFTCQGLTVTRYVCPESGIPREAVRTMLPDSLTLIQVRGPHCGHGTRWGMLEPTGEGTGNLFLHSSDGTDQEYNTSLGQVFTGECLVIHHTVGTAFARMQAS